MPVTALPQLESIFENMADAFASIDHNWRFTFVNKKAEAMLRLTREQLLGRTLWEVFPKTVDSWQEKEFRKAMSDRIATTFETYSPTYNIWLEIRIHPHEDGIAVFYSDITRHKVNEEKIKGFNEQLEKTVKERTAELEKALKEMEDFSYTLSHDLRQPIRAIHGYMSIFLEENTGELSEDSRTVINSAIQNSKKMGDLLDGLLHFASLRTKEPAKTRLRMKELVEDAYDERITKYNGRKIDLRIHDLPDAKGDEKMIRQVWSNLISNALKFTQSIDKPMIEIGSRKLGDITAYYIRDNGAGFDMQYIHKIFGVFQRLHHSKAFEGNGLGLAVAHRIVTRHGGKIWAEGKLNDGAIFYFTIEP